MKKDSAQTALTIRRAACLILLIGLAGAAVYINIRYGKQLWSLVSDPDRFKVWINGFGAWSKIVFVAMRSVQTVVKIIPAEPLEIGSGLVFGAVGGMLLCLLGNIIGSIVILFMTRRLGIRVLELFHLQDKLQSMRFLQDKQRRRLLLLLFYIIPGTPKDGITYFVGLTDINLVEFMVMTSFARIPSIISSTICGAYLGARKTVVAAIVFGVTLVLSILGGLLYKKISARYVQRRENKSEKNT